MTIRAIIWDVGGVLVRTVDPTPRQRLAERLGMSRWDLEHLFFGSSSGKRGQLGQISMGEHLENLGRELNLTQQQITEFSRDFWGGDRVDYALVDDIRSLRRRYQTALLSNAYSDLRHMITNEWHFADAFDEMIISSEVGLLKPDPGIYCLVLERLGLAAEQTVFIDDFAHNIEGAQAVGMHAIQFRDPFQVRDELGTLLASDASAPPA